MLFAIWKHSFKELDVPGAFVYTNKSKCSFEKLKIILFHNYSFVYFTPLHATSQNKQQTFIADMSAGAKEESVIHLES